MAMRILGLIAAKAQMLLKLLSKDSSVDFLQHVTPDQRSNPSIRAAKGASIPFAVAEPYLEQELFKTRIAFKHVENTLMATRHVHPWQPCFRSNGIEQVVISPSDGVHVFKGRGRETSEWLRCLLHSEEVDSYITRPKPNTRDIRGKVSIALYGIIISTGICLFYQKSLNIFRTVSRVTLMKSFMHLPHSECSSFMS